MPDMPTRTFLTPGDLAGEARKGSNISIRKIFSLSGLQDHLDLRTACFAFSDQFIGDEATKSSVYFRK